MIAETLHEDVGAELRQIQSETGRNWKRVVN
jgi:hypothetical protein